MEMNGRKLYALGQRVALGIGLFVLALVPRALALNAFVTPDERRWLERSVKFLAALLYQDWGGTLRRGHPGVTTMWTATVGLTSKYLFGAWAEGVSVGQASLLEFLQGVPADMVDLDYLAAIRFPTVLVTSAFVVGLYFLVGKLLGRKVALLSAVLVALDPFYLAHSRLLHHDALVATFMTLSLLSFLVCSQQSWSSAYLIVSGLSAGLAFLSKATSLFLIPFIGLLTWMAYVARVAASSQSRWREGRRWLGRLLVWGLIAGFTFVALWPAMWVEPVQALGEVWEKSTSAAATDVHTQGDFFLGRPTLDAKVLFYPVTLLFRTTPLSSAGMALAVYFLVRHYRQSPALASQTEKRWPGHSVFRDSRFLILLYMFLFAVVMSLGGIKYDRYLLPIYPALEILAAEGLYKVAGEVKSRVQDPRSSVLRRGGKGPWALPTLALILQAAFVLPYGPYYLTYYNPMVGGSWLAPKMLLVGWGEGLDQAARYLNQQDGAEEKRVAVRFHTEFAPFYLGRTEPLLQEGELAVPPWYATDYVVFYVTQVQRGEPDKATLDYFKPLTPEHVVHLNGIDYAWIYPTPDLPMEEGYTVFAHLIEEEGNIWGQKDNPPVDGFYPTSWWEEGEIVRDQYNLVISPDAPPGEYQIEVGMYLVETGERLEVRGEEGSLPENRILLSPPVTIR